MAKILIAEDEPDMAMGLRDNLQFEGYEVLEAGDGEKAVELAVNQHPDLILLDIMMPKMDGFEACRLIREQGLTMPILMLTARTQEVDIVRGLEIGADDYVTKPFGVSELMARIKAILRRTSTPVGTTRVVRIGNADLDLVKGKVVRGEQTFALGYFEIEILKMLLDNIEQPVPRNDLLNVIWGLDAFPSNRTVDNHIVSLRKKIEDNPKSPQHIITVHSIGYKLLP